MKTPTEIPTIVVNANPVNKPAPAHNNGIIEAKLTAQAAIIIKKALLILSFTLT